MTRRRTYSPSSLTWLLVASSTGMTFVSSLSAHSPRDLYSHPQFNVVVNDRPVLNDTIPNLIEYAKTDSGIFSSAHVLKTSTGQAFLCTIPHVSEDELEQIVQESTKDHFEKQLERERGVENGLKLLEPLRGSCIYSKQNWFTYSFCYGQDIRQFHEIRAPGSVEPVEDPNNWAYTLGQFPRSVPKPPKFGGNSQNALASTSTSDVSSRVPASLGGGGEMGLGDEDAGLYLTQIWDDGTICDKTGLPREVEVQFHCNTETIDRIALIRETAICRYVMIIHTPRLCGESVFLERQTSRSNASPSTQIDCRPVVRHLRDTVDAPQTPQGPPKFKDHPDDLVRDRPVLRREDETNLASIKPDSSSKQKNVIDDGQNLARAAEEGKALTDEEWLRLADQQDAEQRLELEVVFDPVTGTIEGVDLKSSEIDNQPVENDQVSIENEVKVEHERSRTISTDGHLKKELAEHAAEHNRLTAATGAGEGDDTDLELKKKQLEELALKMRSTLTEALRARADPATGAAPAPAAADGQAVPVGNAGQADQQRPQFILANGDGEDLPLGIAGIIQKALEKQAQHDLAKAAAGGEGPPPGPIGYEYGAPKQALKEITGSKDFEKLSQAFSKVYDEESDEQEGSQQRKRDAL